MKANAHFWSCRVQLFLEWEMFRTKIVQKIKTHVIFNNFFFLENHAVNEAMWKNVVGLDRPQITIRRMRNAYMSTNTHLEYAVPIAFPQQQWLQDGLYMLRYTYIAVLFNTRRDWWETSLTVVGHVLGPQRGGSCRGCRVNVDECVSFGNILAVQVIICFRLSLHFFKLRTIRQVQVPVKVHDCENPFALN
jgi:hypothetical protein